MFLTSINYFRAIAIILIVAPHLLQYAPMGDSQIEILMRSLLSGGTSLFVFISGFMFHYVFYPRFKYKYFLKNKCKNIFLPYLILLSLSIVIATFIGKSAFSLEYFNTHSDSFVFDENDSKLFILVKYYLTGSGVAAYWYIPFIMVMFLLSPLHYKFINLKPSLQIAITLLLLTVATFLHRPVQNINIIQSVLYFSPIYLIGMLSSIYDFELKEKLKKYDFIFLIFAIVLAYYQGLSGQTSGYYKLFFEYNGIDLSVFKQISLCFFFFFFLTRFEETKSKLLDLVASTSFATFFIHGWVINVLKMFEKHLNIPSHSWWGYLFVLIMTISISVAIATLVKTAFKNSRKTRYLIGY
jgi:peptidoglycan/LPS O-acetylase OafA/YrhL